MAKTVIDWRALRVSGAVTLFAALLLLAAAYGGSMWLQGKAAEYQRARNELARAASRYRNASDDKAVYEQYALRFRRLQQSGMVGVERRLSWVEALQTANRDLKLPVLRYEIEPQRQVPLVGISFDTGHFELYRSEMTLNFGALHEADILRLLRSLARTGDGLMEAEACRMQRARGVTEFEYRPGRANLDVTCAVGWYTLQIEREGDA